MSRSPLVLATGFIMVSLFITGCSTVSRLAGTNGVIQSQTPGAAVGAGAAVIGPANSAAPTTQVSERRTAYYAPQVDVQGIAAYVHQQAAVAQKPQQVEQPTPVPPTTEPLYPAWTYEKVTTTIGQHQDAAGLVKAAQVASGWSSIRWLGILIMVIGTGGWLYSYNNKETGYPLIFIKVFLCGAIIAVIGSNPWLLLLLLIPLGFYAFQKLAASGFLKLPIP